MEIEDTVADTLRIVVRRGEESWEISPSSFDATTFQHGDRLAVVPREEAARLLSTLGDLHIRTPSGDAIRVPPIMEFCQFKGFRIPVHLVQLTGGGPETLDSIGRAHLANYERFMGLREEMTVLEIGCGIGRDAFQLIDLLGRGGRYVGIDVTRDSILWCRRNITERYSNFTFHHFDAQHEIYNPYGKKSTFDFRLPLEDGSVDRIILASVFTHLLEDEILHYMREFRRVLGPAGLVYASFFLYSDESIAAARLTNRTPWQLRFEHDLGNGMYTNDIANPRSAVAITDESMRRMVDIAGLCLVRPYLKGWWSGAYEEADDGQDAAILARDDGSPGRRKGALLG